MGTQSEKLQKIAKMWISNTIERNVNIRKHNRPKKTCKNLKSEKKHELVFDMKTFPATITLEWRLFSIF